MIRALRVSALVLTGAAAVYMALAWPSSPERMPMQWDLQNRPTWYAPRAAFFGTFAGMIALGLALSFVRAATPVGAALTFSGALLLHVCTQAANHGHLVAIPVHIATFIVLGVSFAAAIATATLSLRSAATKAQSH